MKGLAVIKEAIQEAEVVEADFETDEDTVARLASLSPIEYDRVRRGEAKRMQVRAGSLDTMVEEVRGNRARTEPRAALFCDPEPWSCLVDGPELLDRLVGILRHHLVLPDGAAEAIALWIMFAHAHDSFDVSPILAVTSPTPECGKTTLMTMLGALVAACVACLQYHAGGTLSGDREVASLPADRRSRYIPAGERRSPRRSEQWPPPRQRLGDPDDRRGP